MLISSFLCLSSFIGVFSFAISAMGGDDSNSLVKIEYAISYFCVVWLAHLTGGPRMGLCY